MRLSCLRSCLMVEVIALVLIQDYFISWLIFVALCFTWEALLHAHEERQCAVIAAALEEVKRHWRGQRASR